MFVQTNLNPLHKRVGDCVIRAIAAALGQTWEETYVGICLKGLELADMPSSNAVWGSYLRSKGFSRHLTQDTEDGSVYTVADFVRDNPRGSFVLAIDGHVVCVKDGFILDSWDSSDEVPIYCWAKDNP